MSPSAPHPLDQSLTLPAAHAHYRAGRFAEAEQMYQQLHRQQPTHPGILTRLGTLALWRNQLAVAEQHFRAALAHTPWLMRRFPFTLELYSLLALTAVRQGDFARAARDYHQAAGPVPVGPLRDLQALSRQCALFGDTVPYQVTGPATAHIPLIRTDPLPALEVVVNEGARVPFFIDTGAADTIIDPGLAAQVGASRAGRMNGGGGGTRGQIETGKVASVRLGEVTIREVPVHLLDTAPFAAAFDGLPVRGVIGTRLLMQFLATLDYPHDRLTLRSPTDGLPVADAAAFRREIPFWLTHTHYMVTPGSLNDREPVLFFVDTGLAGVGFSADNPVLHAAGIVPDWSQAQRGVAAFGATDLLHVTGAKLTLGSGPDALTVSDLTGVVFKQPFGVFGDTLGFYIGGVVSHQFFRAHALTLDFARMRLVIHDP